MVSVSPSPAEPDRATPEAREHDDIVILDGASWSDYQRALEIRGERRLPQICFLEGRLQFMNPSHRHEGFKSSLGRLLEVWCLEHDIDFMPYGSWTLERKEAERGVEPDECYLIGPGAEAEEPERPDLAIEVVWTSGGLDKLQIYRKLGVPEVWYWKKGAISVHLLVGDAYEPRGASSLFPTLDLALLAQLAERRPVSKAMRELRALLAAERREP